MMSRLDWFWRRLIVTSLYTKGWGKPGDMKRIFNLRKKLGKREICRHLVPIDYPVYIDKEVIENDCRLIDGHFMSPLTTILPGIMPKEVEVARFQMVLPKEWKTDLRPLCVQMGGTGDHGFGRRRRWIAKPLLQEEGIASLILENPFYGSRKPKYQFRSSLHNVSDLFVMGGCLILESLVIFNWLDRLGYGPLGASGISMGGHMASLGATNWHKPLSLIPCMSGATAAGVFTHGVLSTAIPWKQLMEQYTMDVSYHEEVKDLIESPEPYWMGKHHHSMYTEGRQYFHDLEEACDSDSDLKSLNQENSNNLQSQNDISNETAEKIGLDIDNSSLGIGNSQSILDQSGIRSKSSDQKFNLDVDSDISKKIHELNAKILNSQSAISSKSSWMSYIPYLSTTNAEQDQINRQVELDCKHFMRGVMDECTHLGNFSVPLDPELIIIVSAEYDEYIPTKGYLTLNELWPGSQVRTIPTGHISGFFTGKKEFRKAIRDSFDLHAMKYYNKKLQQAS